MRAGGEGHRKLTDERAPEADAWLDSLDTVTDSMAVLDRSGRIVAVNPAWTAFADANGASGLEVGIGANYLVACDGHEGVSLLSYDRRGSCAAEKERAPADESCAHRKCRYTWVVESDVRVSFGDR